MQLVKLYTISKAEEGIGLGGYGSLVSYTDSKGVTHEKALNEGETVIGKTGIELRGIVDGLDKLTKPCRIEVYTDSTFVIDAIRYNWVEKWVENNWKRRRFPPVRNVDLWSRLISKMEEHDIVFKKINKENMTSEVSRCEELANVAYESANCLEKKE